MQTLKDNTVLIHLRALHVEAMTLKEKFDIGKSPEVLEASAAAFLRELNQLSEICPPEVLRRGNLLRHAGWIQKWLSKGEPQNCYNDLQEICYTDIFTVQEYYLRYLTDTNIVAERFYDWQNLHPVIQKIAKGRFESSHFADAVEASFKEINDIVKKAYRKKTSLEDDGVSLMRQAFTSSANNTFKPVFALADNTNENGRNIQQGYMNIFAGCMLGIRNPKAHANLDVNPDEAWEMIMMASHLIRMWEKFN